MFDALTDREVKIARNTFIVAGFAFVGVVVSGIWMLLTNEADGFASDRANRGSPISLDLGRAHPAQDIHTTCSLILGLIVLGALAWTMFSPSFDLPKPLVWLLVLLIAGAITGPLIGFVAVELDGVFDPDVRSYVFVFDPGLGEVAQPARTVGALTFRIATVAHIVVVGGLAAWVMGNLARSAFADGFYRRVVDAMRR